MKFLAINTAGPAVEAVTSSGEYFYDGNFRNASSALMPAVDNILNKSGLELNCLDYIACVVGPGSFTGIRVGVSSARAMCYALNKPALGIHYLRMLAYNERADGKTVLSVSDGGNGTAYIAEYDQNRRVIKECECVTVNSAVSAALSYKGAVCADERLYPLIECALPPPKDCSSLFRAARDLYGEADSWQKLIPVYVRVSQAEQDLNARCNNA